MHLTLGNKQKHETWPSKNIPDCWRRDMCRKKFFLQQTDRKTISRASFIPQALLQYDPDIPPIKK